MASVRGIGPERATSRACRGIAIAAGALALAGCQQKLDTSVKSGSAAYQLMPPTNPDAKLAEYRIGPLDTIDITVFQEPDLSMKGVKVDASGGVLMPLIGRVEAAGATPTALSKQIATKLGEKFLQDPQVSVVVTNAVSQKVAVEGSVTEAGVYEMQGQTTLLEAIAMAKGTSRTAALNQVIVFREVQGKRSAAVFNVAQIRRGIAPDPEILGNDLIVVGFSNVKAGWRDFLSTAPILNVFRPY